MDSSGYDLKAWQTYYESQGYDSATASSYAYYALQSAAAAAAQPALAGPSYTYPSASTSIAQNPWDPDAAQQQLAYGAYDPSAAASSSAYPGGDLSALGGQPGVGAGAEAEGGKVKGKRTTVIRKGGGKMWDDPTLTEWDPKWFRLFVSDVSNDCTEKVLTEAFEKYKSFQKVKVVKDRLSNKSKYAFLAFSDPEDFLLAWKQMDGKYVGNRPIRLSKATTNVRSVDIGSKKAKMFDKAAGKGGVGVGPRGRVM